MKRFCFLLFFLAAAVGCAREAEEHLDGSADKENFFIREGRRLFIHYCSPCHGEAGDGFGPYFNFELGVQPASFIVPDFLQNRDDEILFLSISDGSASLGKSNLCPPWGKTFRREEIECLIDYIKELNEEASAGGLPEGTSEETDAF